MRDHTEPARAQPANLRDHFLGQAVTEVFLGRVIAHVRERQNDEPRGEVVGDWLRLRPYSVQVAHRLPLGLDRCNEAIATPVQRLHEPRVVGIVAKRRAKPLDRRIQAVLEVDERSRRPEKLAELLAHHNLARPIDHHRENLKRLILKPDADSPFPQLARAHVDLEGAKSLHVR